LQALVPIATQPLNPLFPARHSVSMLAAKPCGGKVIFCALESACRRDPTSCLPR
jgi:hypothetical protein